MLGALVLVSAIPVNAASTTINFSKSGSVYGVKTSVSGYSTKRTAWAKVENNGSTAYGSKAVAKNGSGSVSVTKTCKTGTVTRSGGSYAS